MLIPITLAPPFVDVFIDVTPEELALLLQIQQRARKFTRKFNAVGGDEYLLAIEQPEIPPPVILGNRDVIVDGRLRQEETGEVTFIRGIVPANGDPDPDIPF